MRINELWEALEKEALAGSRSAWLLRHALPKPSQPLLIALETSTNRRALLVAMPEKSIPGRQNWPRCNGLEVFQTSLSGQPHFGVRLLNTQYSDVFSALAEDVAPRVGDATDIQTASSILLGRLRRWQKFLAAGNAGLSVERQRGLYGELSVLKNHLIPTLGAVRSVSGWRAPDATHQDFQFGSGAIEVKTTIAKQPQLVRITSERQLDPTGIPSLFLHVVVLDEREIEEGSRRKTGETLPEIIASIRTLLAASPQAHELFDDHLLNTGYLEADAPRYEIKRFTKRREHTFQVKKGFPCLTEKSLPTGVGDVSYALSIEACRGFSVSAAAMIKSIKTSSKRKPKER